MAEWIDREIIRQPYVGFEFFCDYGKKYQEDIGIHSSQLNLYRVSDGNRYNEDMSAAFQDKVVQAPGRDGTFYFGTNYTQRVFNIQLAFDKMTEDDMHEFRRIFSAGQEGYLIFDETPYKQYKVKIQSVPQLKYIVFDEQEPVQGQTSKIINTDDLNDNNVVRDDSWRQGNRVYKGEGSIQFVAYYPFAIERYGRYKYLADYCKSSNLVPGTYRDADKLTRYKVTYEVEKTSPTYYNSISISAPAEVRPTASYYYFANDNSIILEANTLYWINTPATNKVVYALNQRYRKNDGNIATTRVTTARGQSTQTWVSYFSTTEKRVYPVLSIASSSTTASFSTQFFPVLVASSTMPTTTVLSTLCSIYGTGKYSNNPLPWSFDFNTWKYSSRMKEQQQTTDTYDGNISYDTPVIMDTNRTDSLSSIIFSMNETVVKVFNAGEVDTDIMFYFSVATTGSERHPSSIRLMKRTDEYDEFLGGYETKFNNIDIITISSTLAKKGNDKVIRYNSKTNLLEGGEWKSDSITRVSKFIASGQLYNEYITGGDFFKIPAYEAGTVYYICATPTLTSTEATLALNVRGLGRAVEYHHVWY